MMIERFQPAQSRSFIEYMPDQGGAVHQIGLDIGSGEGPLLLLEPDAPDELDENPWFRGRFLFPFNDRIPGGVYSWRGETHQLPLNDGEPGDALHGFAWRLPARVVRRDESSGHLTLLVRVDHEPGYPFQVELIVDVHLSHMVRLDLTVANTGKVSAPVSLGWHPYFAFPEAGPSAPRLCVPADRYVPVDERLVPTGELLPVRGTRYDFRLPRDPLEDDLDIALTGLSGDVVLEGDRQTVRLSQDRHFFPYLQLFLPPDRRSIAVEPITAATNAFNMPGLGLMELEPNKHRTGWVEITAEPRQY